MTVTAAPTQADNRVPARPVVFVWPDRNGRIDAAWARDAQTRFAGTWISLDRPARAAGLEAMTPDSRDPAGISRALLEHGGDAFWLVTTGYDLPDGAWSRLSAGLADTRPRIRIPTSNQSPAIDPWPMHLPRPAPAVVDNLVAACGWQLEWPVEPGWPRGCVALNRAGLEILARGGDPPAGVLDTVYVHAPDHGTDPVPRPASARAPLGHLRARLAELADSGEPELPRFFDRQGPVTLHITHHWGGGITRWIDDVVAGDRDGLHLVLAAGSDEQDRRYGQWLRLYAAGAELGCIQDWQLAPAIIDTDIEHAGYRAILDWVLKRYGVGRILVSSLIGHSLDCLDTDLPTVEVLHDGYPAWPLLDIDPRAVDGGLEQALRDHAGTLLFAHDRADYWQGLSAQWRRRILDRKIPLAAPSRAAIERWAHVLGRALPPVERIPHGFAGWPAPPAWTPRPPGDRRLHLVVIGRMNTGKGLNLLLETLPELRDHARITLLGCGRGAFPLLGRAGVNLVFEYRHADLPDLIARLRPDAALFLSTVPETWNYGLSEIRALGVVPVATRRGSFVERIRDGVDGLLIDPDPGALVEAIERLAGNPATLDGLRDRLPEEPTVAAMLDAYARLAPATGQSPAPPRPAESERIQLAWRAGDAADLAAHLQQIRTRARELEHQADERARWAQTMERQFLQRTAWAEQLQAETRELTAALETTRQDRDNARAEQARLNTEITQLAQRIDRLETERQQFLSSRSWRLTRPLRVAARILRNARRSGIASPARWPRMSASLVHYLWLHGWRHTLYWLQIPGTDEPAPVTVVPTSSPQPGQPLIPVEFPAGPAPRASIIVPVHNQVHFTAACLHSLKSVTTNVPFEVIVVDDASGSDTTDYLRRCTGLTVLRNNDNLGFTGSCNRGGEAASGEFLVFLNNDTSLTDGWLDALLEPFERDETAGIVGARLVFPDGNLQEAGGIVFNDASGWNYGRGDDPDRPEYRFVCEADYVSGACLAISRQLFRKLKGFDPEYAPAYYEDTDLCFRVREQGLRVLYQPAATVIHHEGATSGTDEQSGVKRYQAVNRGKFRARWAHRLERQPEPINNPANIAAARAARHWRRRGRILVIDAVTPTPDHDSGSLRLHALLDILVREGCLVSFMAENLAWSGHYSEALQQSGIECLCAPWVTDIEQWLTEHGRELDMVIVSRHYVLAPLIRILRQNAPRARVVFDTVDLHFLREEREAKLTGAARIRRQAARTRRQELAMIRAADHTLVVSPAERQLLAELIPDADVHVVSNIHTVYGPGKPYAERQGLLFVGGFQHKPNVDAAIWLMGEIFPLVQARLPDAKLHIIGSRMPPHLRDMEKPGIQLHGFVPDLEPWLTGSRLSIAPLRYGAGVKGKVNQAMAHGIPVIATSCAAEGMYLENGRDILIADTAADMAAQIERAYTDPALWQRMSEAGLANVERHFSAAAARRAIRSLLDPGTDSTGRA